MHEAGKAGNLANGKAGKYSHFQEILKAFEKNIRLLQ